MIYLEFNTFKVILKAFVKVVLASCNLYLSPLETSVLQVCEPSRTVTHAGFQVALAPLAQEMATLIVRCFEQDAEYFSYLEQ